MTATYCGRDLRITSDQTLEKVLENAKAVYTQVQNDWKKIETIGPRPPEPSRYFGGLGPKSQRAANAQKRLALLIWEKKSKEYMENLATVIA
jgi:hypothetical protein